MTLLEKNAFEISLFRAYGVLRSWGFVFMTVCVSGVLRFSQLALEMSFEIETGPVRQLGETGFK